MFEQKAEFFMKKLLAVSALLFIFMLLMLFLGRKKEDTAGQETPKTHTEAVMPASSEGEAKRLRAQIEDNLYGASLALADASCSEEKLLETAGNLIRTEEMVRKIYGLQGVDEAQMEEYMTENLDMLSAIYALMARRNPDKRRSYYDMAAGCIEKLFKYDKIRESSIYEPKLLDLVSIKEELGENEAALEYLRNFEKGRPQPGIEVYVAHACILLKNQGNGKELRELYEKMSDNDEFKTNFRYDELRRQMDVYLSSEG